MTEKKVHHLQGKRMIEQNTSRAAYDADLEKEAEAHLQALKRIREGGVATKVRILASHDSCPVCRTIEGAYEFEEVPSLPVEGCSHPLGCRCHYEPVLDRYGP